jgi:hypothetical protein
LKIPEVNYVEVEVEAPTVEEAFESYHNGGDFIILDGPDFSHNVPPDYGERCGDWYLTNERGEDIHYVRVWSGRFIWAPFDEANAGYGY